METHEYSNGEITIRWTPKVCIHAGICVMGLPEVYDTKARLWVKPHNATTARLTNPVGQCLSGALSIKEKSYGNYETGT